MDDSTILETRDLRKEFGGLVAVAGVSMKVRAYTLHTIIGPNGAGKSTLLHCIAGLIAPQAGRVLVEGVDVHRAREAKRALLLSLLTQTPGAVPRLSVRDLVGFGRWPHHRGRPGAQDHALIEAALARFDLLALAEREVEALSGGQRQRVFVAMAFAQATPWMLLDEPLAALDPKFARDIMERLQGVARAGPGVLLVLHDLSIAARYADRCICMKQGRVVAAGDWATTVTSDLLSDLYDTPMRLARIEGQAVVVAG